MTAMDLPGTSDDGLEAGRLEHFPVSFFAVPMGLMGSALALHAARLDAASAVVGAFGTLVFAVLAGLYGVKAVRYRAAVSEEWHHPVRIAFFPAFSIGLLLIATFLRTHGEGDTALAVWALGAILQAILTLAVVANWIGHRAFGPGHLSPAWFIPAVGNVVVPLAGVPLGFVELSWYFFSIGLLFWIVLLTLVFNRLVFHDPMPGRLRPTLVILIAPPAVAFLAWLQLNGGDLEALARVLFYLGLFFAFLVLTQVRGLLRLPFALSFWALSFPLAAMSVASFRFGDLSGSAVHTILGWAWLTCLALVVAVLLWRTTLAVVRREICRPE